MFHLFEFLQEEKQKFCFCGFALLSQESGLKGLFHPAFLARVVS